MLSKTQTLILCLVVFFSLIISNQLISPKAFSQKNINLFSKNNIQSNQGSSLSFQKSASFSDTTKEKKEEQTRKWDILDPTINAEGVLVKSLDSYTPLFSLRANVPWPAASLTKLLTSVIVLENIGENKKIPISELAVHTLGDQGGLQSGEVYTAQDLMKIMLIASSNDAASAFEESIGGKTEMARRLNKKAEEIGMKNSLFYDAAGLNNLNATTAHDMALLIEFIAREHPTILSWTRIPSFIAQPLNDGVSHVVKNINPFINDPTFLGGKTGTSPEAQENLVAIFSLGDQRIMMVLLGSQNRKIETTTLFEWIKRAYIF